MRALLWLVTALSVAAALGCSEAPVETFPCSGRDVERRLRPVELARLPNVTLDAAYVGMTSSNDHALRLFIYYGTRVTTGGREGLAASLVSDGHAYCPEVDPSLTVALDGVELANDIRGDWSCLGTGGAVCSVPRFSILNPIITPDSTLVVEDRSMSTTIAVSEVPGIPKAAIAR